MPTLSAVLRFARLPVVVLTACVAAAAPLGAQGGGASPDSAVTVGDNGFAIRHVVDVAASPDRVYDVLVEDVAKWWNGAHTWSADAANLSIDARPGGCLCERLPSGGGVEHLRVVYASPGLALRFAGALGPLQSFGVTGHMEWALTPTDGGSRLTLSYIVGGYSPMGFERLAPAVSGVLLEQLTRLVRYVETGSPG